MFQALYRRIYWSFFRRLLIKARLKGFKASIFSNVTPDCDFSEYTFIYPFTRLSNTKLGRFSYINHGSSVSNCTIGAFTSIGPSVRIGAFGRHSTSWISTHPSFFSIRGQVKLFFADKNYFDEYLPINIGNDVWIGEGVMILDGVNIGDGAVVAAGSLVTRDVKPYEVVGGMPAKNIKFRFSPQEILQLEQSKWWEKDISFFQKYSALFRTNHVGELLALCSIENTTHQD